MEEKNYDQDVEETTTQNSPEEDTTEDVESTDESPEVEETEEREEIDWKERALKAEKAIEKAKKKEKKAPQETTEDLTIARLEARGILDARDQNDVLKYAKAEGISPIEALDDEFVQAKLAHNKKQRLSVQATPKGNNRANNTQDEVDVYVKRYKEKGASALPENNPRLVTAVLRKLKNGA